MAAQLTGRIMMPPRQWAESQFGTVDLGDERRERRLLELAAHLAETPRASLSAGPPRVAKAYYRLLSNETVSFEALATPHWEKTRALAGEPPTVLLIQDTTELDYTGHPTTEGLGPIGNGKGRGFLLHTTLAVVPETGEVLGLMHQKPFVRKPSPERAGTGARGRRYRERESQVWERAVEAIGPAESARWVYVADRYADIFAYMEACRRQGCHFVVRAAQDRRLVAETSEPGTRPHSVMALAEALLAQGQQTVYVPARPAHKGQPAQKARQARVAVAWKAIHLASPRHQAPKQPLALWMVRIWEEEPPEGVAPLDWVLLTSVPTERIEQAWQRRDWYMARWLIEDYHQCLKTGCRVEARRLGSSEGLVRLLGVIAVVAVYLLQLRQLARQHPTDPALTHLPRALVEVVAALFSVQAASMTVDTFWRLVARRGGFLGRKGDGNPGWKTLWEGYLYIQAVLEGARLRLDPGALSGW